jgi:hypothetical protein
MIKDLFLQKLISHMHVCSKCMDDNLLKKILHLSYICKHWVLSKLQFPNLNMIEIK